MLTHVNPVLLHLPSVLLVHGPHVTIKEARRIRDHVSTASVEKKFQACHEKLVLKAVRKERQTGSGGRIRPLGKGCETPNFHIFSTV